METTHSTIEHELDQSPGRFSVAGLCRWAGVGIFAYGAAAFLLQGLDTSNEILRNWSYLVLMVLAGAAGICVQRLLADGKSARLLLGIGVTLVPVQIAQLAGLIHDLASGQAAVNAVVLLSGGVLSFLVAVPVTYMGLRVLARPQANILTPALLTLAAALLLPWREGVLAYATVAAMACATVAIDRHLMKQGMLQTLEATSARLLLALPLFIAVARSGFYLDNAYGEALFGVLLSGLLVLVSQVYLRAGVARELLLGVATLIGVLSFGIWADAYLNDVSIQCALGLGLIGLGSLSRIGWVYRVAGMLMMFVAANELLFDAGVLNQLIALALGLALMGAGYTKQWREPVVAGAFITFLSLCLLCLELVAMIDVSSWMGLAVGGVALVIVASVLERHGRRLMLASSNAWQAFKAW